MQGIKDHRLFARNMDEWKEKYGRFLNASEVMAQIRRECEAKYPFVDIDSFLTSYREFGSESVLKKTLNPNRNEFGGRMRGKDDKSAFFTNVMRYLLGTDETLQEDVRKPDARYIELLSHLDPALVFLMYFPIFGNDEDETNKKEKPSGPLLSPFSNKDGDRVNKIDLLSMITDKLKSALKRLYPDGMFNDVNPFLENACYNLTPSQVGTTAKEITVMDIVNLVYAVFDNITVNIRTDALRYANDSLMDNRILLKLPKCMWKTNRSECCHIEAFADGYLFTRYYRVNDLYYRDSIFVSLFFDNYGQMVAYAERPEAFRKLVNREKIDKQSASYFSIKLYDGEKLLTNVTEEEFRPTLIEFSSYGSKTQTPVSKILNFEKLWIDKEKHNANYVGNDKYKTTTPDDGFTPMPLVWMRSSWYIYVQCQAEEAMGEPKSSRIVSWYRLPRLASYNTWLGDTTDLLSVKGDDVVALRQFRQEGVLREFLVFTNLSLAVEVTKVKHPNPGEEFPYGVVIVPSPNMTLHASVPNCLMTVSKAVYKPDDDGPKAEVTYSVISLNNNDNPNSVTVTEEVVVFKEK